VTGPVCGDIRHREVRRHALMVHTGHGTQRTAIQSQNEASHKSPAESISRLKRRDGTIFTSRQGAQSIKPVRGQSDRTSLSTRIVIGNTSESGWRTGESSDQMLAYSREQHRFAVGANSDRNTRHVVSPVNRSIESGISTNPRNSPGRSSNSPRRDGNEKVNRQSL
jgi:hypothetical protein